MTVGSRSEEAGLFKLYVLEEVLGRFETSRSGSSMPPTQQRGSTNSLSSLYNVLCSL